MELVGRLALGDDLFSDDLMNGLQSGDLDLVWGTELVDWKQQVHALLDGLGVVADWLQDHLVKILLLQQFGEVPFAELPESHAFEDVFENPGHLRYVVGLQLSKQFLENVFAVGLHLVVLGHDVRVLLDGVGVQDFRNFLSQSQFLEELHDFLSGEVVGELGQFVE